MTELSNNSAGSGSQIIDEIPMISALKESRGLRKDSSLFRLLERVSRGSNLIPKNQRECIILEIDKNPVKVDATFYDNRFRAFASFVENFYWIDTEFVGVADRCIRVYLRPVGYNKKMREEIFNKLDLPAFHREMKRCEIHRAIFYGKTLVLHSF